MGFFKSNAKIISLIVTGLWVVMPDLIPFVFDDILLVYATYKGYTQQIVGGLD